jgi:hypothetical protein
MNRNFTPLSAGRPALPTPPTPPSAPGNAPARPTPEPAAAPTPAFRPLSAPPDPGCAGEPKLTLERDGERVTRITVQCTCGRTIELACA